MLKFKKIESKSIENAIQQVLTEYSINEDELIYTIIDEGKSGILGMGSKPAAIEYLTKNDIVNDIIVFLTEILTKMDIDQVEVKGTFVNDRITLEINSNQNGLIIGKDGQTLQAIQFLISQIIRNHFPNQNLHIFVDVSGYRKDNNDKLIQYAIRIAHKVAKYKKDMDLRPMNSYQRRIIHEALMDDKFVTTESAGEGPDRHIVIKLK
ncbi:RNA-binding cell elongation regulator Jag/EloR [Culicoidibacter larvae]|uniref:RNA-binding protein KhpB n=1 Tax=Culicoidibacter larvae TaxID=2579976 RepID=A0A5R8QIA7_9FIRM|nr:RNA-binding cell elongation regulator Jag/EloR [Culicoidibacter larvae]TLG77173.1 protein jag [Culicoidibacter larvae]